MSTPLSPKPNSVLNVMSTTSATLLDSSESHINENNSDFNTDDTPSSPFVTNVSEFNQGENVSPNKPVFSGADRENISPVKSTSPLKVLKSRATQCPTKILASEQSPRKLSSPEKRFPIKVSAPAESRTESREESLTLTNASSNKEGPMKAIEILEDNDSMLECGADTTLEASNDTIMSLDEDPEPENFADETAFSAFSAVPDMTMFARIGHSPTKYSALGQTPGRKTLATPATSRRPITYDQDTSPTPRRAPHFHQGAGDSGNTTNLILDFTEQFNSFSSYGQQSPTRSSRLSPSKTVPELLSYTQRARTPSPVKCRSHAHSPTSKMSNLLDFDIPPAPTPRSMPSITPRELESLKSGFLSEISSLKASLSGKEAEVLSLKTAVGDAEKRVGECMEQLREVRDLKEQLSMEKEGWEKRGREMEQVLRNVKDEIVHGEREREELEGRLDESEKRREAAEMMAQEAESKMAGIRAGSASEGEHGTQEKATPGGSTGREVEIAVEKVARELHTLYKSKHETKVAALKKSYEGRWDRKVKELEVKVEELSKENEDLKTGGNATMSSVVPRIPTSDITEELRLQATKDAQHTKELEARLEGLAEEIKSVKRDNADLRYDLEQERIEKGDLVAACDELLSLQSAVVPSQPAVTSGVENLRGSVSRASGLRAPNFSSTSANGTPGPAGGSRIAKADKSRSGSAQGARPGSGLGTRSGIMTSIEKMGSYKGRPE